jgi:hypothetical protein
MVDKPNPSSERKLKQQKKSLSDYNVTSVKQEDVLSLVEPRLSFLWILNKSENKEQVKVMPFINDQFVYLNSILLIQQSFCIKFNIFDYFHLILSINFWM